MLKTNYNISTLSFLIASFNETIDQFGKNNKSVAFYKSQVEGMISIGHVRKDEAQIIEEVVGMVNTDAVKWESAEKKIKQFIQTMNIISGADSNNSVALLLKQMVQSKQIENSVADIVRKIFNINKSDVATPNSFGKLGKAPVVSDATSKGGAIRIGAGAASSISSDSSKSSNNDELTANELFNRLDIKANIVNAPEYNKKVEKLKAKCQKAIEVSKTLESQGEPLPQYEILLKHVTDIPTLRSLVESVDYIADPKVSAKIRNLDAVCSCDPSYYICEYMYVFSSERTIDLLIRHAEVQVGKIEEGGDSCHPTKVMNEISNATTKLKNMDFDIIKAVLEEFDTEPKY